MNQAVEGVEYLLPDPKLRRAVVGVLAGFTAAGFATVAWGLPWLQDALLTARANGRLTIPLGCYLFLALIALLAVPVIWFGGYAVRFGSRVLASGQYPPPGSRVIRRTPVVRGPVARFTGRGQQVLGVALMLCGLALIALVAWGVVIIAG